MANYLNTHNMSTRQKSGQTRLLINNDNNERSA